MKGLLAVLFGLLVLGIGLSCLSAVADVVVMICVSPLGLGCVVVVLILLVFVSGKARG